MNPLRILIALPVHEPALAELRRQEGIEVECVEPLFEPRALPAESLAQADVLFTSLPPTNFEACRKLRWVQIDSSGYNQLLPLHLPDRGIRASNAAGIFDVPIGEWCIAMMINLARDLRGMIRNQERGIWDRDARHQMEVNGKTVGIWGYGGIGRHTARLAKALGMKVSVLTRRPIEPRIDRYHVPGSGDPDGQLPDERFLMDQKDDFLARLDFLVLAMPLTQVTEGIVGEHELRQLKPSAFVLNPVRGPLIQERPLLRACVKAGLRGPRWILTIIIRCPPIIRCGACPT